MKAPDWSLVQSHFIEETRFNKSLLFILSEHDLGRPG